MHRTSRFIRFTPLILMILLLVTHPAAAGTTVNVWLTTTQPERHIAPQPDRIFGADQGTNPFTITVNDGQQFQSIDGFGASLTDSSAWLLYNKLDGSARDTVISKLFSPTDGIGIGFLRQPMGASDFTFNGTPYSYDDMPVNQIDPNLTHFSIDHDRAYIIPLLKQAVTLNPAIKIMASPWSPPGWMKSSLSLIKGSVLPVYFRPLADYFVKFIQAYQAEGIPIYAISPQNEPTLAGDYPGALLSSRDQAVFVKNYLRPALDAANLSPKVLGHDNNWRDQAYVLDLMTNAAPEFTGIAYHCYVGDLAVMNQLHALHPEKEIYETECSSKIAPAPAIETLILSVRSWARSVVLWNLVLDNKSGPRQGSGCTLCIGLVTVDQATSGVTYTSDYDAIGHASKFVMPGAHRIESNSFGSGGYFSRTVIDVAFANPDGSIVLIVYNGAPAPRTVEVDFHSQSFTDTLPALAIATYRWIP